MTSQTQLFGRDSRRWNMKDFVRPDWPLLPYVGWQPTVLFTEGAERQRRTGALNDALDALDRTELTAVCEQVADLLIDDFCGDGEADLIRQYAYPLPAHVMVRLFGLPEADLPDVVRDVTLSADMTEESGPAYARLRERVSRLVTEKQARPGDDLPSRLLAHSARLTDEEAVLDIQVLVAGAHGPTANWIGNTLRLMLMDDDFSITLQGGRSSVGQALNEVLWKDPPLQNAPGRWAVQDCELAGRRIRRGDMLVLGIAAANADPQVQPAAYPDSGANRAHMSFSHGEYGCPFPAPELGELIAKTAVEVLLDRLPDVDLGVAPEEVRWRQSLWMRSLEALPVRFSPTAPMGQEAVWSGPR
ncbi:cytochrome P450 family protein [Thermocatellispora tengchongensis]|uniref:cytochrome P450 n=1 Tax=Thermocatellispora tengchongensis TaxID=1073253 RepID=UPI003638F480